MLSVVMLSVIMLSVVMLSVIMLSVVMLSVVMLSVVMLSIVAPSIDHKMMTNASLVVFSYSFGTSTKFFINLHFIFAKKCSAYFGRKLFSRLTFGRHNKALVWSTIRPIDS